MKRYYFRWTDSSSNKEYVSRIIADDFGEAMQLIQKIINKDEKANLKLSDFTFLKEEDETRPWVNKGLDPSAW